ncbi:hypothetical protein [Nocardia sp. NPDC052566]|uniref:hypothetical protein n=1 Tax=Nocardia sp. NPDC052566 TaxID=3364330 RepID=UPI0037CBCCFF
MAKPSSTRIVVLAVVAVAALAGISIAAFVLTRADEPAHSGPDASYVDALKQRSDADTIGTNAIADTELLSLGRTICQRTDLTTEDGRTEAERYLADHGILTPAGQIEIRAAAKTYLCP